jgi:hypothetical protein
MRHAWSLAGLGSVTMCCSSLWKRLCTGATWECESRPRRFAKRKSESWSGSPTSRTQDRMAQVHGILPSTLTREGLWAGVDELAARASIPVQIDVETERFPPVVEATAYFVVAEARGRR